MICCSKCFKDIEIKDVIKGLGIRKETCPLCERNDVYIYDTDINNELEDLFSGLLEIYSSRTESEEYGTTLTQELIDTWEVFDLEKEEVDKLLKKICVNLYREKPSLFTNIVTVSEYNDKEYMEKYSILRCENWNDFVKEITDELRYHTDLLNKESFSNILSLLEIPIYKERTSYYRARIVNNLYYGSTDIGAPPKEKATDGRANSRGIPCLYLASSEETASKEIRAGLHDKLSIGKFIPKKDLSIINLMNIDTISPFVIENPQFLHVNKRHLKRIGKELSKTLRSNSSDLEYLPTQYISDFIKSLGYDGIKYKSTLNPEGYNLAVFDVNSFEVEEVKNYTIDSINTNLKMEHD